MSDKIKIVIVDDHILFSQSLSFLIGTFKDYEVIGSFPNGKAFITKYDEGFLKPDIVLLDVNMPIMNGIETMKYIKANYPDQKVLALSVNNDEDTVMKMLTNGARGYILKDTNPGLFNIALMEVYEKGFYYTEMVSSYLVNNLSHQEEIIFKDRELEFIKLACTELAYKEIADRMALSPKTIDGYREAIFQRLNIRTRVGLVLYAIKNGIIVM